MKIKLEKDNELFVKHTNNTINVINRRKKITATIRKKRFTSLFSTAKKVREREREERSEKSYSRARQMVTARRRRHVFYSRFSTNICGATSFSRVRCRVTSTTMTPFSCGGGDRVLWRAHSHTRAATAVHARTRTDATAGGSSFTHTHLTRRDASAHQDAIRTSPTREKKKTTTAVVVVVVVVVTTMMITK